MSVFSEFAVHRLGLDPRLIGTYAPAPVLTERTNTGLSGGETFNNKKWDPVQCPRCGDEFPSLGGWAQHFNPIDRAERCQVKRAD